MRQIVASIACATICLWTATDIRGEQPQTAPPDDPTPAQLEFFEKKIRPLLVARCQGCHGEKKQSGDLRLDSHQAILQGGESGTPVVVPGNPAASLLIDAVRYGSLEMPPKGRLPDEEVELLVAWVRSGAPWPKEDASKITLRPKNRGITPEDRNWWSFHPIQRPAVPEVADDSWSANVIDRFILARLREKGIQPSAPASPATLARRLKTDLIGLPVTPEEREQLTSNASVDAYERLVDQWLESPQFGERWARHWLDLVRYAESDGYKQDAYRPQAWLYRDYVIRAFNQDKPYDRFVREQLAGDEIYPPTADTVVATGFLRAGIYEYNQRDVMTQWSSIVGELTDVTADVFLGLSMGCARCHDHKYDPIAQDDYLRLRSVFAAVDFRDNLPLPPNEEQFELARQWAEWEQTTAALRAELATIEDGARQRASQSPIAKFPPEVRMIFDKPESLRTPHDRQIASLAWRQVELELEKLDFAKVLKGEEKERWEHCHAELEKLKTQQPPAPQVALGVMDVGTDAPEIYGKSGDEILPGPPVVFTSANLKTPVEFPRLNLPGSTGRRTAFARWVTSPQNPLTARVIVNRIWQYHFGRGLTETTSDLGHLGALPTHPELLDWLAAELIDSGWSLKHLHRLILTSSTYRQASHGQAVADSFAHDPSNQWWGRTFIQRLDAEILRDEILAASGELLTAAGGPSVELSVPRRTIYTKVLRNKFDPLLDEFDVPDNILPTPFRNTTVTPNQSLLQINGEWMLARAKVVAKQVAAAADPTPDSQIAVAYQSVFGRSPTAAEKDAALGFFYEHPDRKKSAKAGEATTALIDFCHVLLNTNELLYVD